MAAGKGPREPVEDDPDNLQGGCRDTGDAGTLRETLGRRWEDASRRGRPPPGCGQNHLPGEHPGSGLRIQSRGDK